MKLEAHVARVHDAQQQHHKYTTYPSTLSSDYRTANKSSRGGALTVVAMRGLDRSGRKSTFSRDQVAMGWKIASIDEHAFYVIREQEKISRARASTGVAVRSWLGVGGRLKSWLGVGGMSTK